MGDTVYRVDPRMFIPVVLAIALGLLLIVLEGFTRRGFLLLFLLAPFFYLGAEILARTVTVGLQGLSVSKLLRTVSVQWSEIESLDAVQSGAKLFLIIQTHHARPIFLTNTIAPFKELANQLLESVPKDRISESAYELLRDPPLKRGPLVQAWGACLILAVMVAGKLLGYA